MTNMKLEDKILLADSTDDQEKAMPGLVPSPNLEMEAAPPPSLTSVSSNYRWTKQFVNRASNRDLLLEKYKQGSSRLAKELVECQGTDSDPINILCMDGGGMKGYSHLAVVKELQAMLGRDCDLMQFFDMTCGTSVGGIAALMQGYHGTNKGCLKDSNFLLDKIREESFKKFSLWNLFKRGSLTTGKDKIAHIVEEYYGNIPLHNPGGLKAFAVCTVCDDDSEGKFEPFVLRSYDLPKKERSLLDDDDSDDDSDDDDNDGFEVDGTNEVLLCEAMAATSAAPLLFERVKLDVNGKKLRAADGCLMSNAPVEIAISEARRLWPKRPLGIILSLGLDDRGTDHVAQVIEKAVKVDSPDLHHLRLTPPIEEFPPTETDPERIQQLQQVAAKHVWEHEKEIKSLLSKLKESGSRTRSFQRTGAPKRKSRQMSTWLARAPVQGKMKGGRRVSAFRRLSRPSKAQTNRRGSHFLTSGTSRKSSIAGIPTAFQEFWKAAENDPELKQAMQEDTSPPKQSLPYLSILVVMAVFLSIRWGYYAIIFRQTIA